VRITHALFDLTVAYKIDFSWSNNIALCRFKLIVERWKFIKMPIRLLGLDLDGTLLNSHGQLSERNRSAIYEARRSGVKVAVVTGRRFRDARPLATELGLDVPVISHNGALTKHAETLLTVSQKLLPLESAREVLRVGKASGADALVSIDPEGLGLLLYDRISEGNKALANYIEWSTRVSGNDIVESVRRVESLEAYLEVPPVHISFSGTCASMKRLAESLQYYLEDKIQIFSTIYPQKDFTLLDILHPEASKGTGLKAAAEEQGLKPEEVMAIGDNFNDIEMLRYAGVGVVMGNADNELKSIEGLHVTATNDEDGVAIAIERFINGLNKSW
jgi:5-amino-6-(5-phospho-D-ribitylamino)uracil phosphatase